MMKRPTPDADEATILADAKAWVKLAASDGFEAAIAQLDSNPKVAWSQSLFEQLTFDHFEDGRQPQITDPDKVPDLRVDAYEYDDGSAYGVAAEETARRYERAE